MAADDAPPKNPMARIALASMTGTVIEFYDFFIYGTAAALVLQVLGIIEPNLLAAYSSNLFGITCVAIVKIRHVRPYKRQLILDSQTVAPVYTATQAGASGKSGVSPVVT